MALRATMLSWLPLAVGIVIVSGLIYMVGQQTYRQTANDPQIQIAQDIATALNKGDAQADAIVPPTPTAEMSPSLSTFVVIFNATGTPIGASAGLNGQLPTVPEKMLLATLKTGENRVTWEPEKGLRIAAVITSFKSQNSSGFILVGRSLKETEKRIALIGIISAIAALVALALSFLSAWMLAKKNPPHEHQPHEAEHHHTHTA